jgi:hypothetical protein
MMQRSGVIDVAGAVAVVRSILGAGPITKVGIRVQNDTDGVVDHLRKPSAPDD